MSTEANTFDPSLLADPPPELQKAVLGKMGDVKMLPEVAARALDLANDPETSTADFAAVIQQDVKLASDVLSMANSVLYAPQGPTASLKLGIARIGFRQCKTLIIASSLASVMKKMTLEEQWIRDVLWRHSMLTGVLATHLNRSMQLGFDGEEFTAGLVHDFGRILLAVAYPGNFPEFDLLDFDETSDILIHEQEAIQSNHSAVGAWFAEDQGLPKVLCDSVRYHHVPELAEDNGRLAALVATADHMANHFQRESVTDQYHAAGNPGPPLLEERGIPNASERFLLVAEEIFEQAVENANEMVSL